MQKKNQLKRILLLQESQKYKYASLFLCFFFIFYPQSQRILDQIFPRKKLQKKKLKNKTSENESENENGNENVNENLLSYILRGESGETGEGAGVVSLVLQLCHATGL